MKRIIYSLVLSLITLHTQAQDITKILDLAEDGSYVYSISGESVKKSITERTFYLEAIRFNQLPNDLSYRDFRSLTEDELRSVLKVPTIQFSGENENTLASDNLNKEPIEDAIIPEISVPNDNPAIEVAELPEQNDKPVVVLAELSEPNVKPDIKVSEEFVPENKPNIVLTEQSLTSSKEAVRKVNPGKNQPPKSLKWIIGIMTNTGESYKVVDKADPDLDALKRDNQNLSNSGTLLTHIKDEVVRD